MNAYVASAARLGAALARDRALPGWLARGVRAGEVPRRSLATVAALTAMVLAGLLVTGTDGHLLVLATTSCLTAIYVVGCAAGVRLLSRRSLGRRVAIAATVLVAGLLLLAGPFLVWPLVLATGALTTRRLLSRRVPNARREPGTATATPPTPSVRASSLR